MSIANRKPNQNNAEQPLLVVKLVFVGDSGAGKTSLLSREYDDSFTK
jgi:GTPase SAR1 family protein